MKKFVKTLLTLGLVVGISLSLCSCVDLDEIRETRVSFIGENQSEVNFQGNTYKQLDKKVSDYLFTYEFPDMAYATQEEVPLLLTEMFGKWVSYSKTDTRIIQVESTYYCREDLYDYAKALIEKNEFNYTCILTYDYKTGENIVKMLDNSVVDTVNKIIDTTEPVSDYPNTYSSVSVLATDEKGLFMHNLFYVEQLVDGGFLITMDNLASDISGYIAPEKYNSLFEELFPDELEFEEFEL